MSTTKLRIPATLPEESEGVLSRLFREIDAEYSEDKAAIAAKFAAGLLLPRFAGTMLMFLRKQPFPVETLLRLAADFQREDPDDTRIRFRLAVALEYLKRTGCARPLRGTITVTEFGREVYQARFDSDTQCR